MSASAGSWFLSVQSNSGSVRFGSTVLIAIPVLGSKVSVQLPPTVSAPSLHVASSCPGIQDPAWTYPSLQPGSSRHLQNVSVMF